MTDRNRSPLRYLPWLARDVARGPLALFVVVAIALAVIIWRVNRGASGFTDPVAIQRGTLDAALLYAVLIATGGIVSTDTQQGFYRGWFSKPIAPWWHYLQRWLLGGVAVLLIPVVYGAGLALLLNNGTGISPLLMAQVAEGYLLYGSAVLLVSTLTRGDWLIVFLVSIAQTGLHTITRMQVDVPAAVDLAYRILPPFHLLQVGGEALGGRQLAHLLLYGAGMLGLAMVILLRRPLGSGGRA